MSGWPFPASSIALAVVAVLGPGMVNVEVAVGITLMLGYTRLVRATVLSIKTNEYVEAAYAMGARPLFIVRHHVLPNVAGPIIVLTTAAIGWAIIIASSMSFLGLGVSPPTPNGERTLRSAMSYLQLRTLADPAWGGDRLRHRGRQPARGRPAGALMTTSYAEGVRQSRKITELPCLRWTGGRGGRRPPAAACRAPLDEVHDPSRNGSCRR